MPGTAGLTVALGLLLQAPAPGWPASAGPAPLLEPASTPADTTQAWLAQRRRLRIQFGVSAGAFGASAAALALSVAFPLLELGEPGRQGALVHTRLLGLLHGRRLHDRLLPGRARPGRGVGGPNHGAAIAPTNR